MKEISEIIVNIRSKTVEFKARRKEFWSNLENHLRQEGSYRLARGKPSNQHRREN